MMSLKYILLFVFDVVFVDGFNCDGCASNSTCHIFSEVRNKWVGCYGTFLGGGSGLSGLCADGFDAMSAGDAVSEGFTQAMCDSTPDDELFFFNEGTSFTQCNTDSGGSAINGMLACTGTNSSAFDSGKVPLGSLCSGISDFAIVATIGTIIEIETFSQAFTTLDLNDASYGGAICIRLPTPAPTEIPTSEPSSFPTELPTSFPSFDPTIMPTNIPSTLPTEMPSFEPTQIPTEPTGHPTELPSVMPTNIPTEVPSSEPTDIPTVLPTDYPSEIPSTQPTHLPSEIPSSYPSDIPSFDPTNEPSMIPSNNPTEPTSTPSLLPTNFPTDPSEEPSAIPSNVPTAQPTTDPTILPSNIPSNIPTTDPSAIPTITPTMIPTAMPSEEEAQGNESDDDKILGFTMEIFIILAASVGVCLICLILLMIFLFKRKKEEEEKENDKETKLNNDTNSGDVEMGTKETGTLAAPTQGIVKSTSPSFDMGADGAEPATLPAVDVPTVTNDSP